MRENIIHVSTVSGNATPAVKAALSQLRDDCQNKIIFEQGVYTFYREETLSAPFYPANNASGVKNVVFPLLHISNLTIDGSGSEFLFCDRIFPFIIQNSHDITLQNFSIDFSFPRYCQGVVKNADSEGIHITIDRSCYPFYTRNGNVIFQTGQSEISTAEHKLFLIDLSHKMPWSFLFAGECSESKENLPVPFMETYAEETEDGLYFRFLPNSYKISYLPGDLLLISNDENRENDIIFAEFSQNLTFQNINIYRGAGMGLIAQLCHNISFSHVCIAPRRNSNDLFSITADAIHLIHCTGLASICDCKIINTVDDAVNIHGVYTVVDEILDDHSVRFRLCHQEQQGLIPYLPGDCLRINDPVSMSETGKIIVTKVICDETREKLTLFFAENIREKLHTGDILENPDRMPEVEILRNTIKNCPHMRLSSSQRTLIADNHLALSHTDIYISDLFDYWYESGTVHDVSICRNTFAAFRQSPDILITSTRGPGTDMHPHENIVIANNRFVKSCDESIHASFVQNLTIKNNIFF